MNAVCKKVNEVKTIADLFPKMNIPESDESCAWKEYFEWLIEQDIMAPFHLCISMLCFDKYEMMLNSPWKDFYFEMGIEMCDAEKEFIYDGARDAGLLEKGVRILAKIAVENVFKEYNDTYCEAIYRLLAERDDLWEMLPPGLRMQVLNKYTLVRR